MAHCMEQRIAEITEGRSLDANIALLLNNARVGTRVAVAHAAARRGGHRPAQAGSGGRVWSSGPSAVSGKQAPSSAQSAPLLVVGGALMDTVSWPAKDPLQLGTSNPGQVKTLPGGAASLTHCPVPSPSQLACALAPPDTFWQLACRRRPERGGSVRAVRRGRPRGPPLSSGRRRAGARHTAASEGVGHCAPPPAETRPPLPGRGLTARHPPVRRTRR